MELNEQQQLLKEARKLNGEKKYEEVIVLLTGDNLNKFDNEEFLELYVDVYNQLGIAYDELGLLKNAIDAYKKALEKNQSSQVICHNLGFTLWKAQKPHQAIKWYRKALEIGEADSIIYNNYANALLDANKNEDAIIAYNRAIDLNPNDAYPYNGMGNVYVKEKNYNQAIKFFLTAIEKDKKYPSPYNGLGIAYMQLKKNDSALKALEKAIKLKPAYSYPYFNKAILLFECNQNDQALQAFNEFIRISNNQKDYYTRVAKRKIIEIKKRIKDIYYDAISQLVKSIQEILHFDGPIITHYTSLSATKNMVLRNSFFRLSEGAFLNDTSEGRELFNFLNISTSIKEQPDTVDQIFTQKPFIGSFVAENMDNNLTLWRMYGKESKEEAKGCAITMLKENFVSKTIEEISKGSSISPSSLNNDEFKFYKVAYRRGNSKKEFIIPNSESNEEKKRESSLNSLMFSLKIKVQEYYEKVTQEIDTEKSNDNSSVLLETKDVIERLNAIAFLFKSIEYQHE